MGEIYFKKISNENVTVREIKDQDSADLFELFSNSNVMKYLGLEVICDADGIYDFIEKVKKNYQDKLIPYLGIELNSDKKLIGYIGLSKYDLTKTTCQVVYALNERYWHKGIMSDALRLFVDYLFDKENKEIIIATHIDENINSGRVMVKAGFTKDRDYDRSMTIKGIRRSLIGYSIKRKKE